MVPIAEFPPPHVDPESLNEKPFAICAQWPTVKGGVKVRPGFPANAGNEIKRMSAISLSIFDRHNRPCCAANNFECSCWNALVVGLGSVGCENKRPRIADDRC